MAVNPEPQVRTFIAIELPDSLRQALSKLQASLKKPGDETWVKWVDPASIHLTLKFLGYVLPATLPEITTAMTLAASEVPPFELAVSSAGAFPNLRRVQVVWVGLVGDLEILSRLQQAVEARVAPLGFPTEARPFSPHLTLARVRETAAPPQRQELGARLEASHLSITEEISVTEVSLMRSQLRLQGAIYTRLATAPLLG